MLARGTSATPWGIDARQVRVEIDVRHGIPRTQIVGLPDTAVRESRERVGSAIGHCGYRLPQLVTVINLAPADIRKEGNHLDAAIAVTLLAAHGELAEACLDGRLVCGELGLDGTLRPIRGALSIADLARRLEMRELLVPAANAPEAAALGGVAVIGPANLAETIDHLEGRRPLAPTTHRAAPLEPDRGGLDLADVRGQETAKRALEIAAAGGHNLLFIGPPGSGKTMLAQRLPGLLPPLSRREAIEVTKIYSVAGRELPEGLVRRRPFRSPHAGISPAGLIGGGSVPRPGEITLAHAGVLFLDELPEFQAHALESLRQPLEDGAVTIARARGSVRFPARFALLAAMNPCPCAYLGDPRHDCRCMPAEIDRYRKRISGPLLDRIDLHVEVPAVTLDELKGVEGETTAAISARVASARERQRFRLGGSTGLPVNAAMGDAALRRHCRLDTGARKLLDAAFERLGLSARAVTRILKVARTVADLAGREGIGAGEVAEAIQYRSLDRRIDS